MNIDREKKLGAGSKQPLEHGNTDAAQGNTHTSQQQNGTTHDGSSHVAHIADSGGEHGASCSHQSSDSHGSSRQKTPFQRRLSVSFKKIVIIAMKQTNAKR